MNEKEINRENKGSRLLNNNFVLLIISNWLLYIGVYMLFPILHKWIMTQWQLSELEAVSVVVLFGVAMFIPGLLNNYLVDSFKRKTVCIRSIFCFAVLGLAYPYVTDLWMVVLLRILQGSLFGLVLMSTGSTLVIDVTPKNNRTKANYIFAFSGILGTLIGLFTGVFGSTLFSMDHLLHLSAIFSVLSLLLVSMVTVSFRAPMNLPLFSFDRFLLFRNIIPGLNMMIVPLILGMIIGSSSNSFFYLCVAGGFMAFLSIAECVVKHIDGRVMVLVGIVLMLSGMYMVSFGYSPECEYLSGAVIGFGTGMALIRFLKIMIMLPLHCERGTGYNTYQLFWELGFMTGIFLGDYYYKTTIQDPYFMVTVAAIIGIIFYSVFVHSYFVKKMREREV